MGDFVGECGLMSAGGVEENIRLVWVGTGYRVVEIFTHIEGMRGGHGVDKENMFARATIRFVEKLSKSRRYVRRPHERQAIGLVGILGKTGGYGEKAVVHDLPFNAVFVRLLTAN